MATKSKHTTLDPVVDEREACLLQSLTERYERLVKPGPVRQLGGKIAQNLPRPVKEIGKSAKDVITEQELYEAALKRIGTGFGVVQEQAARFSVSDERIIKQVGETVEGGIGSLSEVCLARAYDISSIVAKRRFNNLAAAFVEGAATGVPGFVGIPFNLVLSTFLYFRAVQIVALTYGYDVRNDAAEMEIAGQVFASAMNPAAKEGGNGATALIGKIMMVSEASALRQTAAKTWTDMAARGGVGLLITQMRALAHKAAQTALKNAGKAGLETSVFRTVFEQVGRRLTLKTVQRAVPIVSGAIGAFFDTGQMKSVIEYADIFYAKRFILEKETRVSMLLSGDSSDDGGVDSEGGHSGVPVTPECRASEALLWSVAGRTAGHVLNSEGNSVYSPACIFEGMRALSLGAAGSTAKELGKIVGNRSPKKDWLGLERQSKWAYGDYSGRVLTGVWLDESAKPEKGFEAACKRSGIAVANADLSASNAGEEISRWISDATDGFVAPHIDLDPLALASMASVLYLKDAWEDSFSKRKTKRGAFHAVDGDIEADYMTGEFNVDVSDDEEAGTLVALPLSNGASMMLLLPREGRPLSNMLRDERIFDFVANPGAKGELVELHLPKFSCESNVDDMADVLLAAGFSTASNPDLSRMTGLSTAIVSYSHGAKISIDEDGLEAGAYFAMVACGAAPDFDEAPPTPRVITFDRPFLYFVVSRTGQPLFIGVVAKPEADDLAWVPVVSEGDMGDEGGWIVEDDEIPGICRITLEEDCPTAPYAITCVVYDLMTHIARAESFHEAIKKYESIKRELREYAESLGGDSFDNEEWYRLFVGTWK